MKKGPYPVVYNRDNSERISAIDFGLVRPGASSQEIEVWVWNKMNFQDAPAATDVRISVVAGNKWADDLVENKRVSVKSKGVMDPDSVGIVDDSETEFPPIGGGLTEDGDYHRIGDIPSNCARRLIFRLDLPIDFSVEGVPRFIIQAGFMSEKVKWLYVAD